MPAKKQIKKTVKKQQNSYKPVQTKTNSLCNWLFRKPAMFALLSFSILFVTIFLYSMIAAIFNISSAEPLRVLLILAFIWNIYYLIKKLPHTDMHRDDFVAIVNGCSLIAIFIPLITLFAVGYNLRILQYRFMWLYAYHPVLLWIIGIFITLLYLYVFGVMLSNIYAKYKRAVQIGISKKMVIASMPFAFLLMWTPGYLIPDSKQISNLKIKSKWYSKFNNWVVSNETNTLFMFLLFVLLTNVFSGALSLLLTGALLIVYALWILRYKTKFIKNINQNYAWCAVGINIAILIVILLRMLLH